MLAKLDIHPYIEEIETCEFLLKYCNRNNPNNQQQKDIAQVNNELTKEDKEKERQAAIQNAVTQGKLERAMTKEERAKEANIAIG